MSNFIDGRFIPVSRNAERWESRSPADRNDVLGEFAEDVSAAAEALAAARRAQPAWERLGLEARSSALVSFGQALDERREEIATLMAREVGKPRWEALGEARALSGKINVTLQDAMPLVADQPLAQGRWIDGGYRYRPLGVCSVLGPFNFPLHLANGHIIAALATGNTVVFKPSEIAPACGQIYAEAAQAAGFPPGVLNVVQGRRATGQALVRGDVDGILFTGSVAVGLAIRRATVDEPHKLVALEMGGKNTAIVLDDADIDRAAYEIGVAALLTCGQRCSATSRVVVAESLAEALIARLERIWDEVPIGHPLDDATFMGPLVNQAGLDKFLAASATARAEDMECIRDNRTTQIKREGVVLDGYYVQPALWRATREPVLGDPHDTDEIFGPDVVVHAVDTSDLDAVADLANRTPYGLAMGIFTENAEQFEALAGRLAAGIINFNRGTVGASGKLPFGGVKNSGNHRPAALLAPHYCTFPVATLRQPTQLTDLMPRFPEFRR